MVAFKPSVLHVDQKAAMIFPKFEKELPKTATTE